MELIKKALGEEALKFVENGNTVGLGSGTTASWFIKALAKKCSDGMKIKAVASSTESYNLAKSLGINLIDLNSVNDIDVYIDGADQVDENLQMIKGLGGALLREKILAYNSNKIIIMIEDKKYVKKLGKTKLPVEITSFGYHFTKNFLDENGFQSTIRRNKDGSIFLTDNSNYILDIELKELLEEPSNLHFMIKSIPGVVETGIFVDLADNILVGHENKKIDLIS